MELTDSPDPTVPFARVRIPLFLQDMQLNAQLVVGVLVLSLLIFMAFAAPVLTAFDPYESTFRRLANRHLLNIGLEPTPSAEICSQGLSTVAGYRC